MQRISTTVEIRKLLTEWRSFHRFNLPIARVTPYRAIEILQALTTSGADLDIVDQIAPCVPYVFWDPELISFFLKTGRDINARDYAGNTALHLAALNNRQSAIQFLLQHNADPTSRNNAGETPLWKSLEAIKDNPHPQYVDPCEGFILMLEATTDMTVCNGEGLSYLHASIPDALGRSDDAIKLLVERFPDVDVRASKMSFEKTPLMTACENNNWKLCQMLVEKKANLDAQDMFGKTPLHYALQSYVLEDKCIKILLSAGADFRSILTCKRRIDSFHTSSFVGTVQYSLPTCDQRLLIDLYEVEGAKSILQVGFWGINRWKTAQKMRIECNYPKVPYSDKQKALFKVDKELLLDDFLDWTDLETRDKIALYRHALLTLYLKSNGTNWDLMVILANLISNYNQTKCLIVQEFFLYIAENMTDGEMESFDHRDVIYDFFKTYMFENHYNFENQNFSRSLFYSQAQFFLKLIVAPYKWWIREFGNQVPNSELERICNYFNFFHKITEKGFVSSVLTTQAMETLVKLDPRDKDGNGILHCALRKFGVGTFTNLIIDLGANVKRENFEGQAPLEQLFSNPCYDKDVEEIKAIVIKMLSSGAHLDYQVVPSTQRNVLDKLPDFNHGPSISLQCLTARVLARGDVKYEHILPKILTQFVKKHCNESYPVYGKGQFVPFVNSICCHYYLP